MKTKLPRWRRLLPGVLLACLASIGAAQEASTAPAPQTVTPESFSF
ncbi:MAG: Rz1-like spanin outer membrane subunit, partial [Opitutaceae bacterium]